MRVIKEVLETDSGLKLHLEGTSLQKVEFNVTYKCDIVNYKQLQHAVKNEYHLYSQTDLKDLTLKVIDNAGWIYVLRMSGVTLVGNKITVYKQEANCGNEQVSKNQFYSESEIAQDILNLKFSEDNYTLRKIDTKREVLVPRTPQTSLHKLITYIKTDDLLWDFSEVEALIDALDETEIDKLMEIRIK